MLGTYTGMHGKPMENIYSHNCMMHKDTMLKFCALFDLEHTKVSAYEVRQGASSPHIKFWDTLFISEINRARKLKVGTLVVI